LLQSRPKWHLTDSVLDAPLMNPSHGVTLTYSLVGGFFMRLKRASLTFAGAAAAVAITTMAASPAWACNDRDPKLQLTAECGPNGANWQVTNPNTFSVPFGWTDGAGKMSEGKINAPAKGSVALTTHAAKVVVIAFRPDQQSKPVWQKHGAFGFKKCDTPPPGKPSTPPTKPTHKPSTKPSSEAPAPVKNAPSGEAGPAKPVKAQPQFTG
jgi:hypothetical protein